MDPAPLFPVSVNPGPAAPNEDAVYGAARPGYPSRDGVDRETVEGWLDAAEDQGIRRICCLLPEDQLRFYAADLLETYRDRLGPDAVLHAPIPDFHLAPPTTLPDEILPFLDAADDVDEPALVHCSAGSGRTGHVLAAWLVHARGYTVDDALATASRTRNPREAVEYGDATETDLRRLLKGER